MSTLTNSPESSDISREETEIFDAALAAAISLSKTFETWITLARGVELAKQRATRIGTRSAFQRILEQQGLAPSLGGNWNSQKSTANKLLSILEHLSAVTKWREGLTQHQRINWSAPTTIYKHCPVFKTDADLAGKEDKSELDKISKIQGESSLGNISEGVLEALNRKITELEQKIGQLTVERDEIKTELMVLKSENTSLKMKLSNTDDDVHHAIAADILARGEIME